MIEELMCQGMSRKEAEIYLALLRYGSSRAGVVGTRTHINRTLVYALLETLVAKGLVIKTIVNGKALYTAEHPESFIHAAKNRLHQAQTLVEQLDSVQITAHQPTVRTFQGLPGMLQMTEIFLTEAERTGRTMLQLGQEIRFVMEYPELIEDFIDRRVQHRIPLHLLCNRFQRFERYLNADRDPVEMRSVKLVGEQELNVDCTTYVYGDSIAVLSLSGDMHGYILENKNIADLHRQMFSLLWSKV